MPCVLQAGMARTGCSRHPTSLPMLLLQSSIEEDRQVGAVLKKESTHTNREDMSLFNARSKRPDSAPARSSRRYHPSFKINQSFNQSPQTSAPTPKGSIETRQKKYSPRTISNHSGSDPTETETSEAAPAPRFHPQRKSTTTTTTKL